MPGAPQQPMRVTMILAGLALAATLAGCGRPDAANIELRKQNQSLRDELTSLKASNEGLHQNIATLESHATTVPVLPQDRLEALFIAQDLKFGRATGGADLDASKPGDEGLKIHVVPIDAEGDAIKAAGAFKIEAFDLENKEHPLIGTWDFPVQDAGKNWFGQALLYTYVLTCPWQTVPTHPDLTIKVTFTDALTLHQFDKQMPIKIMLPGPAQK